MNKACSALLVLALSACGGSDEDPKKETQADAQAQTAVDAARTSEDPTFDAAVSTGGCTSAEDVAGREAEYDGKTYEEVVEACGRECIGSPDCVPDCIRKATNGAVSDGCITCYAENIRCSTNNCIAACIANSESPRCIACQCGDNNAQQNCNAEFGTCTGEPQSQCE